MENNACNYDSQLVKSILAGNTEDFRMLWECNKVKVKNLIASKVPRDEVDDITQNAFLKAYRSLNSFSCERPFRNWLLTISQRCCCDYWRKVEYKRNREIQPPGKQNDQDWLEELTSNRSSEIFQQTMNKSHAREILALALQKLSTQERALIKMIYYKDIPLKNAAQKLDWGLSNTKVRAVRVRRKLRKIINNFE